MKSYKAEGKKPYYEQVAEKLIKQLEEGTAPWQRPWEPGETFIPHNPISGTKYKGSNAVWLAMQGRSDPRWMTYKQAQSVDAQVLKGEKGTLIQYWKTHEEKVKTDENGNPVLDEKGEKKKLWVALDQPRVFSAVVFNAEQIQGLPPLEKKETTLAWERHERAEAIIARSGARIYHDQNDRAFYTTMRDSIHLPPREQFKTADRYYATTLHELGHWTGHESRLNRDLTGRFGSGSYAKEELRAEIASLMIGDETGVGHDPGQHAAYVKSWIKVLKEDPKELFRAARDAEKIKDLVMSYERQKPLEKPQETDTHEAGAELEKARFTDHAKILALLNESHAKANPGFSSLESWENLEKAAQERGLKARLAFTKVHDEFEPPVKIQYEKDGQLSAIETKLSPPDGKVLTEVYGERVQGTNFTSDQTWQREALDRAIGLEKQKSAERARVTEHQEVLTMLEQAHTQTGKSALTSWKNHKEIASENSLKARLEWTKAPKENQSDVVIRYERLGRDKPIHTELNSRSGKTITKYDGERIAGTKLTTDRSNQEYSLVDAISKDRFAAKIESMSAAISKERQEKAQEDHQARVYTRGDTQSSIQLKLAEKLSKGFADDSQRATFLQKVQSRLAEQESPGNDIKIILKQNNRRDDIER